MSIVVKCHHYRVEFNPDHEALVRDAGWLWETCRDDDDWTRGPNVCWQCHLVRKRGQLRGECPGRRRSGRNREVAETWQ